MGIKMVNLYELIKYHPYHSSSFAERADVTSELLWAAIQGEEELTPYEIFGIVRLTGVPGSVITCPRLIWLESKSYRHRKMVLCLTEKLKMISAAAGEGNKDAEYFVLKNGPEQSEKLINDFWNKGKVTYCRYLGVMAFVDTILGWMLKKRAEGIEERAERRCGMITVLSRQHNIISVDPEDVPENRKGQLIAYLPEWDAVAIAGWKENTALITELITEYLELTHSQHGKALSASVREGLSGTALDICAALERIYQIRRKRAS